MKTMSKKAALKRLEASKVAKQSMAYHFTLCAINGQSVIRPCYTSGWGRFKKNMDYSYQTSCLLTEVGFEYEEGNDAPRGAATGKFFKITTKIK